MTTPAKASAPPHSRVSATLIACTLLLSAAAGLSGCADVSVNSRWQEGASRGQSFQRVLIVGVSPDYNLRCAFESAFASQVRSESTKAFSSCDAMTEKEKLTRDNIKRVVAQARADAVLATTLVAASTGVSEGNSMDTRGTSQYQAIGYGFGEYGMPVTYAEFETAPPLTTLKSSIHVLTRLYETQDAKLLYTLDTKTKAHEVDSTQDSILRITAPTADRLRRDGLVR